MTTCQNANFWFGSDATRANRPPEGVIGKQNVESSANAIHQAAMLEILPATRRDDAIPQRADVVGDAYLSPIPDRPRSGFV
jgi:hypothetical protein